MSLTRIRTNIQGLRAYSRLQETYRETAVRQQRLVTGKAINRAADDSAGYVIAQRLESRTRAQRQALANIGNAKSMLTVAEGGLESQMDLLQTMKEKATQVASGTMGWKERIAAQQQIWEMSEEIAATARDTAFNGQRLLDGSAGEMNIQVGAGAGDAFAVGLDEAVTPEALGIKSGEWTATFDRGTNTKLPADFNPPIDASGFTGEAGEYTLEVGSTEKVYNTDGSYLGDRVNFIAYDPEGEFITYTSETDLEIGRLETDDLIKFAGAVIDLNGTGADDYDARNESTTVLGQPSEGEYNEVGDELKIHFGDAALAVTSADKAGATVERLEAAIGTVSEQLSSLGDAQARLSFKAENLTTARNNYSAARSRIVDTDFAGEQLKLTKLQILQQSGQAAIRQANGAPQAVLQLLGTGGGFGGQFGATSVPGGGAVSYQQAVSAYASR